MAVAFISAIGHQKRTTTQKSYPNFSLGCPFNSETLFKNLLCKRTTLDGQIVDRYMCG